MVVSANEPPRNVRRGDSRTLQARAEGYPARSVFKLQEIDDQNKILKVDCVSSISVRLRES